jgi:membrane protein
MRRFFLLAVAVLGAMPLASKMLAAGSADRTHSGAVRPAPAVSWLDFHELKAIVTDTFAGIGKHDTSLLAAGVAFYALFALFPALAAATWVFGLLANPATIHDQLNNLREVLPQEAWQLIDQQLNTLTSKSVSFSLTGIVSLLIAIYSARTAASSMMGALNVVYGLEETRGFIKSNALAILFTVLAIVILLAAIGVMVVVPILFNFVGLNSFAAEIIRYVRWPALAAVMILALAVVYRYGPNREHARWKWLTWGSATATIIWLIASFGFAWYVSAFNSYDKVYGSIGAVVILLFWFWITAFCGLLGAELDNVIERRKGVPPVDSASPKAARYNSRAQRSGGKDITSGGA